LVFFQSVGDIALGDLHALGHHRRDQVAVGVVADDQRGPPAQLGQHFLFGLEGEALEVRPHLEARNPVGDDLTGTVAERYAHDLGVFGAHDVLARLIAGGAFRVGDQPGDDQDPRFDLDALLVGPAAHLLFQCPHLVENVDHLPARIWFSQYAGLGRSTRAGEDRDAEDHRDAGQKPLEIARVGGFENVRKQVQGVAHAGRGVAPARLESQLLKRMAHVAPGCVLGLGAQVVVRPAHRPAQLNGVANAIVEHQLLAAILMHAQKVVQALVPVVECLEELAGQAAIEEFHTLPDRARFAQPWKTPVERSEIDLQRQRVGHRVRPDQVFLEMEILGDGDFVGGHRVDLEAPVFPLADPGAHRDISPGRVDRGLLGGAHQRTKR
jgi:hypothetical protein